MESVDARPPVELDSNESHFPSVPASWFHLCGSAELNAGPIGLELCGRSFIGYRTLSGRAVVLSGRCAHLGAQLRNGRVHGERLVCPLHGWEYGPEGVCERIPAGDSIPAFARQSSYPVAERHGHVYFFYGKKARFDLPFFEGMSPEQLLPAKPFELLAETPWYFAGANGFDLQHFRTAHDRTLIGPPEVNSPSSFALRVVATFGVSGRSLPDRITRLIAGPQVKMDVTVWCGSLILVRAEFARTTSFGIFNVLPMDAFRTRGRIIVWVQRSNNVLGRIFFDPMNAALRRKFIQTFLRSDLPRVAGLRYQPRKLIAADRVLAGYFEWLEKVSKPSPMENT
jgi:phenylpropionate dioxygenase-like ring-hydroxylating dioxygenase large terminal subunit